MQNKSDNLSHVLLTCTYPFCVYVGAGGLEDGGCWGLGVVVVVNESVGEELEEECLVFREIISSGQTLKLRLYIFWFPHLCFSHSMQCLYINFTEYTLGNLWTELMSIIVLKYILLLIIMTNY